MGADDLELGEVGRHVVEQDRPRVTEFDPSAPGHSCPQSGGAGMEDDGYAELDGNGVEVVEATLVGCEALATGVELETTQAQVGDRPPQLVARRLPLPRVDRGEAHERVGVAVHAVGHEVVGERGQAHGALRVPGQQHTEHVVGAELLGHLVDRADRHLGAEVALGRLPQRSERVDHPLHRREVDVEVDRLHAGPGSPAQWGHAR